MLVGTAQTYEIKRHVRLVVQEEVPAGDHGGVPGATDSAGHRHFATIRPAKQVHRFRQIAHLDRVAGGLLEREASQDGGRLQQLRPLGRGDQGGVDGFGNRRGVHGVTAGAAA